ncbi:hypothetical protein QQ020_12475 [Fulvivirgaceae bacterium BMA12]|uniref:TerB family tellurite resistance protein n=1 Tax=Agaribacillus aureus TaxID=3051825 RepID=A0ABT8L539_9BACT|nr:hypothetical protein [Fulvivirgaceae bacterium BMA12]
MKNLVAIAYADGKLHPSERSLLYTVGEKYGLKGWQIARIIENQAPLDVKVPEDLNHRLDQIYDLVKMMLADDIIEKSEMRLCEHVTVSYGFKKELIKTILLLINKGKSTLKDWDLFKKQAIANFQAKAA